MNAAPSHIIQGKQEQYIELHLELEHKTCFDLISNNPDEIE